MKSNKWFPLLGNGSSAFYCAIFRQEKWDAMHDREEQIEREKGKHFGWQKRNTRMEKYTKMLIIDIVEMFTFNKRLRQGKWRIKRKPYYKQNH